MLVLYVSLSSSTKCYSILAISDYLFDPLLFLIALTYSVLASIPPILMTIISLYIKLPNTNTTNPNNSRISNYSQCPWPNLAGKGKNIPTAHTITTLLTSKILLTILDIYLVTATPVALKKPIVNIPPRIAK